MEVRIMRNKLMKLSVLLLALMMVFAFSGCSKADEEPAGDAAEEVEETAEEESAPVMIGAEYGYAGEDPVEAEVYRYLVEVVAKDYDEADVSIPTVQIVHEDLSQENEATVWGDFWIEKYNIEGDTLKCVSGGNYPGVMHLSKNGDEYEVTSFDVVADGGEFESSAKELFGDSYEDFMKVYGDSDARQELRKITVSDYVNMNGLEVTKLQDEGWDPVDLYLQ